MKLGKIATIIAACGLTVSTITGLTEKANAAGGATSSVTFSGSVPSACATTTQFTNTTYTNNQSSAGITASLTGAASATFNCNSDTVQVKIDQTLVRPTANTATALQGVHTPSVTANSSPLTIGAGTGNSTTPVTIINTTSTPTDTSGNLVVAITSSWNPTTGTTLFEGPGAGAYSAAFVVTVTAN